MSKREEHWHWRPTRCTDWTCDGHIPDCLIVVGPVSGMINVARELLAHYGVDPAEHPGLLLEVDQAISEEMLDTGRQILEERGIPIGETA